MNKEVKKILIINLIAVVLFAILNIFINNIFINILGFIMLFLFNFLSIKNIYDKLNKLDICMKSVLKEENINIDNIFDNDICSLKQNVKQMDDLIKNKNQLIQKEKENLEQTLEDIEKQLSISLKSMNEINDTLEIKQKELKLNKNKKQIEKVKSLISGLLKLSKLDSGTIELKYEKIKVSSLLTKAVEPLKDMIIDKKIKINLNIRNTDVFVDVKTMSEAIKNIIKNACEHTKDEILIESNTNNEYTEIIISNNGESINKNDLPHIFERFYKGNSNSDNVGIGLSISKKIIEMQKGKIEVHDLDNTSFVIKLYK